MNARSSTAVDRIAAETATAKQSAEQAAITIAEQRQTVAATLAAAEWTGDASTLSDARIARIAQALDLGAVRGYRVGPGHWVVGGSDGYSRKGEVVWDVTHITVGDQTWTVAS